MKAIAPKATVVANDQAVERTKQFNNNKKMLNVILGFLITSLKTSTEEAFCHCVG